MSGLIANPGGVHAKVAGQDLQVCIGTRTNGWREVQQKQPFTMIQCWKHGVRHLNFTAAAAAAQSWC